MSGSHRLLSLAAQGRTCKDGIKRPPQKSQVQKLETNTSLRVFPPLTPAGIFLGGSMVRAQQKQRTHPKDSD